MNGSLLRHCHVMSNIDYRSASNTHLLIYIFLKTLVVKGIRKGLGVIFIYLFYFDLACLGYCLFILILHMLYFLVN